MSAFQKSHGTSYAPKSFQSFINKTKISHPVFGSQKLKDVFKKQVVEQKTLTEIFKKAKEAGVLRETSSTRSEREFYKAAVKEEKMQNQVEQKSQKTISVGSKEANIKKTQQMAAKAERWRGAVFGGKEAIRGMERVRAGGEAYRKQQAATSGLLKSRGGGGMATEGKPSGLLNKAVEEEKDEKSSTKGDKSGQKSGGSASKEQKSGGQQAIRLQGSAGIDQLTHPQEVANSENFTGGVYHVEGLDKAPASQPEMPPVQKSSPVPASAPEDITDLDIG